MRFSILFSPSEDKVITHNSLNSNIATLEAQPKFLESLWGYECLNNHRTQIIHRYYEVLGELLQHRNKELLESIYGAKSFNDKNLFELHSAMQFSPLLPAIKLYSGVAFQGLSYSTLSQKAKDFILEKVLIFSNLFGVLRAKDSIPFYKLKQGTKQRGLTLKEVYTPFATHLHQALQKNEYIIDLRAGIYTKLFMPKLPHFFFDFQKNGKTISHYAKLYRGKILRLLSTDNCNLTKEQCFDYLCSINDKDMRFNTYTQNNNRLHLIYEIL